MIARFLAALAAASIVLAGCGSFGGGGVPENAAIVHVVNATSFAVQMRVNGAPRDTIPRWTPTQEFAVFGPDGPPWQVEFFDETGLQVAGMEVDGPARPGAGASSGQTSTCGAFLVWWGLAPDDIPVVGPGSTAPPPPPCN